MHVWRLLLVATNGLASKKDLLGTGCLIVAIAAPCVKDDETSELGEADGVPPQVHIKGLSFSFCLQLCLSTGLGLLSADCPRSLEMTQG